MTRSAGSYGLRPVWTASSPPDRNPGSKPVVLTASQPHAHWEVSNTQLSPAWPPPIVTAPGVCPPHRRSPPQHQGPAQTHPGQSKSLAHSRPCSGSTAQHKSTVPPQADGAQHNGCLPVQAAAATMAAALPHCRNRLPTSPPPGLSAPRPPPARAFWNLLEYRPHPRPGPRAPEGHRADPGASLPLPVPALPCASHGIQPPASPRAL